MLTASPQIHTPADEPVDQSVLDNEAQSVGHMFRDRVAASPDRPAYLHAVVAGAGDEWVTVTWAELDVVVREIGAGLVALGIEPEDRVAIASSTRYEWALADLAVMVAGGATTTIYPTTMADDVAFIVSDSGAKVVFAENAEQLEKLRGIRAEHPGGAAGHRLRRRVRRRRLDPHPRRGAPARAASTSRATPARSTRGSTASSTTSSRRSSTPRARPAAPRACGCGTAPGPTRAPPSRVDQHPHRGRPAVPLAAAGPRLRQGAAHPAAADRLPHGHRRPDRQDRRQPRRREADLHGRRPAHLREGLRPDQHDDGRRGRRQGQALRPGPATSAARSASCASRARTPSGLLVAASTPSPTSSSAPRSASGSVDGSASSSPARPRSTRTSPAGSTPWGCRSSRATA